MEQVLFFDVGNTNVKLAVAGFENCEDFRTVSLATDSLSTPDEIGLKVLQICQYFSVETQTVSAWVVSSVVPCRDPLLREACSRFFGCPVYFVPADIGLDIENHYSRPLEVGADRLVTAFAARRLFADPALIVVDFGTATTVECVRGNAYLGGLICPGLLSSLEALGNKTSRLPRISLEVDKAEFDFGKNTAQSINQGMVHGFAAMISGLVKKIQDKVGQAPVIATGGHAGKVAAVCPAIDEIRPCLLFSGLRMAWQERKQELA